MGGGFGDEEEGIERVEKDRKIIYIDKMCQGGVVLYYKKRFFVLVKINKKETKKRK